MEMPAGSVSVKLIPARLTALAPVLSTVKASVVVSPRPTLGAAKAFVSVGSERTVSVALTPVVSMRCTALMLAALVLL